jgi:hypothetical protein
MIEGLCPSVFRVDDIDVDHYGREAYMEQRADAITAIGDLATYLISLPEEEFSMAPDR